MFMPGNHQWIYTGFVQSLEFLKMSWNLQSSFPALEKVLKIEIKSWKMVKSLDFFFIFFFNVTTIAEWVNFFLIGQIPCNLARSQDNRRMRNFIILLCLHCIVAIVSLHCILKKKPCSCVFQGLFWSYNYLVTLSLGK